MQATVIDLVWSLDAGLVLGCAGAVIFLLGTMRHVRDVGGPQRDGDQ